MMNSHKKKVCFVLPTLGAGGAERVISFVAQNIDFSKFQSELLIIGYKKDSRYVVDNVNVNYLNKPRVLKSIPSLYSYLNQVKPDIVFSAIGHLNIIMAIMSIFFKKTKFIGREVNVLSVLKDFSTTPRKSIWSPNYIKLFYPLLDKIVCQSNDMAKDLMVNYNIKPTSIVVINNPITVNFKLKQTQEIPINHIYELITIGRLAKQKGHLRILKSLEQVDFPFHYTIIGDGPEKESIIGKIKDLGLTKNVTLIPFTKNISKYLSKSNLFLQGSYVEGFPNALLESCAVGTPVVAFKAPGGIDEIIVEGVNGYIAEDIEDFAHKINKALNSLNLLKPELIRKSVYDKYSEEVIISKYNQLLASI